jgi:N utilization substance protein A
VNIPIEELRFLEREKGISLETVITALESALAAAYKRRQNAPDDARVVVDRDTGEVTVYAQELDENEQVLREWEDTPSDFGRIAAVTAKQVIVQRLREAERDVTFGEYEGRKGDIVTGIVQQRDPRHVTVDLGKVEAELPHAEQVPSEHYQHNDRIKVYVTEVSRSPRGLRVVVSRTHPDLIRRLFELEVPEIAEGIVEITNVAREPGTAPRSRCAPTTRGSTPRAPASAPAACGCARWSTSCGARRSTSSCTRTTRPSSWRRRCLPPRSRACGSTRPSGPPT